MTNKDIFEETFPQNKGPKHYKGIKFNLGLLLKKWPLVLPKS